MSSDEDGSSGETLYRADFSWRGLAVAVWVREAKPYWAERSVDLDGVTIHSTLIGIDAVDEDHVGWAVEVLVRLWREGEIEERSVQ